MINPKTTAAVCAIFVFTSALATAADSSDDTGTLFKDQRKTYTVTLEANTHWVFEAHSWGNGDLDCFAFDQNNNLVFRDDSDSKNCMLFVNPRYTGTFKIVMVNLGPKAIDFRASLEQ